jgi:SAM-dependent methyltransferase
MKTFPEDDERDRLLDSWDEASKGWGRQADSLRESAMPVSRWMVDHARPRPGQRVLELAAGPGDTGFLAAELVKPGGTLICSDAVEGMLEVARERAAEQGIDNVEFKQLQLEWIDLPTASVEAILIKWGVMLAVDPEAALRECRRVLKPSGHIALAVWDAPEKNPWATIPQQALVELGHIDAPVPNAPGMFALADPARLRDLMDDAGLFDVLIEPIPMPRHYPNLNAWIGETIDLSRSFRAVWSQLDDEGRGTLRERMSELAAPFTGGEATLFLPAASLGASASA